MECNCNKKEFFPAKATFEENGFKHVVSFSPGFICEKWVADPTDGSNHGKGSVDLLFIVSNESGAIQFRLMCGWYPDWKDDRYGRRGGVTPMPSDLGYHSLTPRYDGQETMGKCRWLGDKECYYDGSALNAEEPFDILISKGESALWAFLEEYHKTIFGRQ